MLGAESDDKTSYHPLFDFCGKERTDRPDCLFYLKQPNTKGGNRPTTYLEWNGRVVLDYRGEPIPVLALPLTISSKIGTEAARLEAMLRSDSRIEWSDILARMLRRGDTTIRAERLRNALNMHVVRFRITARLITWDSNVGSKALETYFLSTMTAEMVAKNSTKGLSDLARGSGERSYIELLNLGIKNKRSRPQGNKKPKKEKSKTQQVSKEEADLEKKREEGLIEKAKAKLRRAGEWAQAQSAWEAQNPIPAPSIYGETECTAIESIVAFKLASLSQQRRDGSELFEGWFTLDHAAPVYPFDNARMEEFFGSQAYYMDEEFLHPDPNDPYGLLSSPTITAAQTCIVDFLLEPARMQYRMATLFDDGSGEYPPIFMTNPNESYWEQLQTLQSAFKQCWAEVGRVGHPPLLCGLLKLDYNTMTWNVNDVPILTLVWQTIDSSTRTFANWQRRQAESQRAKILQQRKGLKMEEEVEGGEDDVEMQEEEGTDEESVEVEREREEEL